MADLENLLLEAAGRTGTSGRNRNALPPSRRRREGSYSDGGSDSRDDDSDDDRGYSSRKPSGSQVPLKKRLDPTERDDDQGSQDEGDYDDGNSDREGDSSDGSDVGEDLYKNEDDRRKLAQMSELEREMILSERADKKGDKNLTERIRSKRESERTTRSRKETPPLPSSRGVRTSARSADRAAAKDDALNELKARRLKQQDPEAHRKLRDASRRGSGSRGFSPIKRKRFTSASLSSSSSESESRSHSEDEGSTGDGGMADSDDDGEPGSQGPTFDDIREITIRRSKLAKWFMEPWFEELIVGCFVRVGIGRSKSGPIYRLCLVRNVDAADPDRPYKLENKTTYKYLNVIWGNESSAARWQMAMISDSAPTEDEYKQWVREVERSGGRMPTKQDILEKKEAIRKSNTFVYSAATVKQMLQEKKSASSRPLNVAAEKDRLRRELEVAQSKQDDAEVERIRARIQELEASRQTQGKDAKAIRLAEMNRKNRAENFRNASELKPVNTSLKAGEAGYDPFSRRWTRSRNYYVSKPAGGDAAAATNNEASGTVAVANKTESAAGVSAEAGMAATAAALEAAADAGKLVDTAAPVDQGTESNTLHNFELPISLTALQKFGGAQGAQAGFMARKQRIEATIGCRVSENDEKRHVLTLTVSDYKRRRGLL
ncbi:protein RTF1 homolog [Ricinus communis]|uniref:RNA polymerase-associated protein RTF1, putative n=1 Tax=Ricinus communis TaxID=3988 RepID=B9RZ59_RICCO|nr:protein RTF1 homolog [Ricinus communis]EEF43239.1 RNA polymerase-associated protein RTF1, putative [Ricinus communis]|eukprot:XP_015574623.1 protein RTF1 homolog [Ricinus communis]